MTGRMAGVAVAGAVVAARTIVVLMGSGMVGAVAVMMAGNHMFNAGRGRAQQMRQRGGDALQGRHQQQRQNQCFSAEFEHERHSRVKEAALATLRVCGNGRRRIRQRPESTADAGIK